MGSSHIASATQPPIGRLSRAKLGYISLAKDVALFILLGVALACIPPAQGQKLITLCFQVSTVTNGVKTTSCVPISATNRLPVTTSGSGSATAPGTNPLNLCVQRSQVVNGSTVYSCVPVSTSNPLPVNGG